MRFLHFNVTDRICSNSEPMHNTLRDKGMKNNKIGGDLLPISDITLFCYTQMLPAPLNQRRFAPPLHHPTPNRKLYSCRDEMWSLPKRRKTTFWKPSYGKNEILTLHQNDAKRRNSSNWRRIFIPAPGNVWSLSHNATSYNLSSTDPPAAKITSNPWIRHFHKSKKRNVICKLKWKKMIFSCMVLNYSL